MSAISSPEEQRLPALRQDLRIELSASTPAGEQMWVLYDPLQHRFIQIDGSTQQILSIWGQGTTVAELTAAARGQLGLSFEEGDVQRLVEFVRRNNLTVEAEPGQWREDLRRHRLGQHTWWQQLFHHYLFLKIPLVKPQVFLKSTLPLVEPLYTRAAAWIFVTIGLAGLYLVSRQWDEFLATFPNFFTLEGAAAFAISLMFVKALHELGHAYTAVRYGCHVPTMGIAFMMMAPMLYTDVSDAWRISDRRKRLAIDGAGIVVELGLACVATAMWAFMPDGIARSITFIVATTGWIMSLGLNLNPFMRFDGYYIFSDLIGIDNLHPRAFALGRWKMRQTLFAPELACPEMLSDRMRRLLIGFAWATWVYRLVLFTGIALLVYAYFFKALGIVLFGLEIWFFIGKPVLGEIMEWKASEAKTVSVRRAVISASVAAGMLIFAIIPWSMSISIPAVLEAVDVAQVFPPRAARIEKIEAVRGQALEKGAVIVRLTSPDVEHQILATRIKIDGTNLRLARTMSDRIDREGRIVLLHELDTLSEQLDGLLKERAELTVRSPVAGTLLEMDRQLQPGRWLGKSDMIALVGPRQKMVVRGYASETDVRRLGADSLGTFVPDDINRPSISVSLTGIAQAGAASIEIASLASVYGGHIAVEPDSGHRLVPVQSQYLVDMAPERTGRMPNQQVVRGIARVSGTSESLARRAWRQILNVVIREGGF